MRISDWSSDVCSSDLENAWFEAAMKPHEGLVETLFQEMKGRIKEEDASVPQKDGDFVYWVEYEQGAEYKKWYRRPVAGGDAALILDEVVLAAGKEYFRLSALAVKIGRASCREKVCQYG